MFPLEYPIFSKSIMIMGNPMEHFPSGKGSFCRPGRRRVIFRPRCFHSDAVSPLSIFFQVPTHISQGELSHRGTFFRADRGSGQIFSSRPMFPLRCTGFFPSPAWEIPLKLFSSPKWFFRRASSWQSLLPSRGPSHANTPLPRKTFPSGKEIFLAPMFSLRCIVAFQFFFFFQVPTHISQGDVFKTAQCLPSVHGVTPGDVFGGGGVLGPDVCSLMFVCSHAKNYPPRISHRGKPHFLPTRRPARFLSAPMFPPAWRRLRAVFPRTTGRCPMNPSRPRTAEGVAP